MLPSGAVSMVATNAIFGCLAIVSVVGRMTTRRLLRIPIKSDDYLIVLALIFSVALVVTNIIGVPVGGFGYPFETLSAETSQNFLKILFILQFWYIIAVALVKLSILALYERIFSAGRLVWAFRVFSGLTMGWLVSFFFATLFQVWPLWCNWNDCPNPSTDYTTMYVCSSVTDIALDIAILSLPAIFIQKLQMSQSQKAGLIGIFGLGIFCIFASVMRLVYAVKYKMVNALVEFEVNFDTATVNMILWSGIEACSSVICANLPCYAAIFKARRRGGSLKRSASRSYGKPKEVSNANDHRSSPWTRGTPVSEPKLASNVIVRESSLERMIAPANGVTHTAIAAGRADSISATESDLELGQIKVHVTYENHASPKTTHAAFE